jgi:hypothetical protein
MHAQKIHTRGLQKVLELTHCQWLYCNMMVHMKVKNGLTIAQHNTILMRIEECHQIDPADLLVEDPDLLEANFDKTNPWP